MLRKWGNYIVAQDRKRKGHGFRDTDAKSVVTEFKVIDTRLTLPRVFLLYGKVWLCVCYDYQS